MFVSCSSCWLISVSCGSCSFTMGLKDGEAGEGAGDVGGSWVCVKLSSVGDSGDSCS